MDPSVKMMDCPDSSLMVINAHFVNLEPIISLSFNGCQVRATNGYRTMRSVSTITLRGRSLEQYEQ